MNEFSHINNILHNGNIAVSTAHTPQYIYSPKQAVNNYNAFKKNLNGIPSLIVFSVKSCNNAEIVKALIENGSGIDCVSLGEMKLAIKLGCDAEKIVLAGVGKTDEEILFAIEKSILQINVESKEEMLVIQELANSIGKKVRIALRVNPHLKVESYTHEKITTGKIGNKFGIDITDIASTLDCLTQCGNLVFSGFSCHIGSQILDASLFENAFEILTNLIQETERKGFVFQTIDFGGGIGVQYSATDGVFNYARYTNAIKKCLSSIKSKPLAIFEPGRLISYNCAILVSKVLYVKETSHTQFVIIDAGMHNLIRPAMYGSFHEISSVVIDDKKPKESYTIVGPICESSDIFVKNYTMQKLERGNFIAILNAGAYGEVMSSNYNIR
jgi:diaminopimelate decarboxylase